jgi:hypothetical protein
VVAVVVAVAVLVAVASVVAGVSVAFVHRGAHKQAAARRLAHSVTRKARPDGPFSSIDSIVVPLFVFLRLAREDRIAALVYSKERTSPWDRRPVVMPPTVRHALLRDFS